MKRLMCIGLVALMLVLAAVPAVASGSVQNAETPGLITPQFTYIALLNSGLSINSSGKSTCAGLARAYDHSHTFKLTVDLQKSSASGWSTIKSWATSATGGSTAEIQRNYYVVHGTYRVLTTARVYNSSGSLLETQSLYSNVVTY